MKITRIDILFLIWIVPVFIGLFYYGARRRARILAEFGAPFPPEHRQWIARRRRLRAALICLAVLCGILALSGPRYGYQWEEISRKGVDLIVALDCSRSMMTDDIHPTRLDRAKREIYDLLAMLEGDRIGLVAFAGTAFLQCPLTLDYESFHLFLQTLTPDYLPVGGTNLTTAVETAMAAFPKDSAADRAVILITDGEHTGDGDPLTAAEEAGEAGIRIYGIGVGSEEGTPVPEAGGGLKKDKDGRIVVSRLDEDLLKQMSVLTGGSYVRSVSGDMDLDAIYRSRIRELEKTTLSSGRKQIWEDRFQWLLFPAVFFLFLELLLPRTPADARKSDANIPAVKKPNRSGRSKSSRRAAGLSLVLFYAGAIAAMAVSLMPAITYAATPLKEATAAYEAGEYETALKQFIEAQLEDPDNPDIRYNIGNTYYRLGQYKEARSRYESVLGDELMKPPPSASDETEVKEEEKAPATSTATSTAGELEKKALFNLGNTLFRMNRHDDAIARYEQLLSMAPNDEQVKKNLEFVRMAKEQMPPPSEQNERSDQPDDSDSSNENNDQNKDGDQVPGDQQRRDDSKDGNQGDDQNNPANEENQPDSEEAEAGKDEQQETESASGSEEEPEDESESGGMPEGQEEEEPDEEDPNAVAAAGEEDGEEPEDETAENMETLPADRVLNRLQDIPGAALMKPGYRDRNVEKDW